MEMKEFSVDRFLGLNEAADSQRELEPGQAAKMENFMVSDGGNLTLRPGIIPLSYCFDEKLPERLDHALPVYAGGREWILGWKNENAGATLCLLGMQNSQVWKLDLPVRQVFLLQGRIWILQENNGAVQTLRMTPSQDGLGAPELVEAYVPLVRKNCSGNGAGEAVEDMNILTDRFRLAALGDGETVSYKLSAAAVVESAQINGQEGEGHFQNGVYTFDTPPEEGASLEFYCKTAAGVLSPYRQQLLDMRYSTLWGEETDNRCFLWGDGSNLCMYTQTAGYGEGLYLPVGNRLVADHSAAPVTGLCCHYSRLLIFKPDGVDVVTHSAGNGFALRPVSRQFGNDTMGQVQLVENSPRSFTKGGIYDWKMTQSAYRDERYAVRISDGVCRSAGNLDVSRCVTCDDGVSKTYYVFANDVEGTVLVHRYGLKAWTIYRSELTKKVTAAFLWGKQSVFLAEGKLFTWSPAEAYDVDATGKKYPISAVWESGYLDFGMPHQRKHCARIWMSLLSRSGTDLNITARTDRRSNYTEHNLRTTLFDFGRIDFSKISFVTYAAPRVHRVKLKVKKFVYYKLILRLNKPGAVATVLGYGQQLRGGTEVK